MNYSILSLLLLLLCCCYGFQMAQSFTSLTSSAINIHHSHQHIFHHQMMRMASSLSSTSQGEWQSLIENGNNKNIVKKLILEKGSGPVPSEGSNVEIKYVGKLGASQTEWCVEDVIECWLQHQQGLNDILEEPFRAMNIDGKILMDDTKFTEEFVTNDLGVPNISRMQCKKTIMAAKRLWKQQEDFPEGFEFDSSVERGKSFTFVLGKGKVIKAMDLAVSAMNVGEKARIFCRSDYGYGSEGYRTKKGDTVVPPFRSLVFEVELVSSSA